MFHRRLTSDPLHWQFFAALVVFCGISARSQMLDLNHNGMSDIWEQIYNAVGIDPNGDADGDGVPNRVESLAGTDPFDANSFPHITSVANSNSVFNVTMPCAPGKLYQLQSVANLGGTNWTTEASLLVKSGSSVSLGAATGTDTKFFRIAISDVDSDGDGLTDWEEYMLGLNPTNAFSNGQLNGFGQPMSDYAYATNKLSTQNLLTISATDPTANEPDPNQNAINLGLLTVTRGGFPLSAITANLGLGGPGSGFATEYVDHSPLPRTLNFPAGTTTQTITVTPLANTNLMTPVIAMMELLPGSGYSIGTASNASIVIYPSSTPTGTGLTAQYFTNSSTTYSNAINFNPANLKLTRVDTSIDFDWGTTNTFPITNSANWTIRWTGQVQPEYSEIYYFETRTDDGVRLWVNDQLLIDKWQTLSTSTSTNVNTIALQAGVHYNLKLEYFTATGTARTHLSWYSASQSRQIIPSARLYPTNAAASPAVVTSPLYAVGFLGQPFSFAVIGANSPNGYSAKDLPPGLSFNSTNGIISGVPGLAGEFQVSLTASNNLGLGASVVLIQIFDTGSSVVQEIWTSLSGTNVSDIPVNTPATITNVLGTLEGVTDYGDNYGERVRGYLTVPVTGNYYFWIAASDSAELWISNDNEPVNKVKRAWVNPTNGGTASRQWNIQSNQKSGWLALVAGQTYYLEVLHKAGVGTGDNWAVGWTQDSTSTSNAPNSVVPGYVISRYYPLPVTLAPGTLYNANLLAQGTTISSGVGTATMRVSADGTQATVKFSYSGLTGPVTSKHIHTDAYLDRNNQGQIVCDFDEPGDCVLQADGSYLWTLVPHGTLSVADIQEIIKEGKSYINLHTAANPAGEINGHFSPANGSQTFTPPPTPLVWTDDHANTNAAARFLIQATFGPSPAEIASVQLLGYTNWIDTQIALPATHHLPTLLANASADPTTPYPGTLTFNTWWRHSITAPDQLRQRVAFALSEIMVASDNGVLQDNGRALSDYYDTLLDGAFGNFRDLLENVTLSPAMGLYLDMRGNKAGSIITGVHANENYGREILQLFSVGLYRLWPDGTLIMNSQSSLVPTYTQDNILGFASVFTGWNYYQANQANGHLPINFSPNANYTNSMVLVPLQHELGPKLVLDNTVLPPAVGAQTVSTNVEFDNYGLNDLEKALDSIFYNENMGPFICRELIQRLVTSNPSRDYLYRVVQKFNDDGNGVRGDLSAVIKAILLDYEARSSVVASQVTYGKQREPVCRVTAPARAFPAPPTLGGTYSQSGTQVITVTTTNSHRMNGTETVKVYFTDTSGQPAPPTQSQGYGVTVTASNKFTLTAPGIVTCTYGQVGNVITVTNNGHGLLPGFSIYLQYTTGGAISGSNQVVTVPSANYFTVNASDSATRVGTCYFPKLTGGGYVVQNKTNVTVATSQEHGLTAGDSVYLLFAQSSSPPDSSYQVLSVPDTTHFTINVISNNYSTPQNALTTYALIPPPLTRSGNALVEWSTWQMGATDTGTSTSLLQTPLNSPTVFNFYFPDFRFPGQLASAGLTTPEFQLTSDTGVVLQMNFLESGVLTNSSSLNPNTNGLSSFNNGSGAIMLDLNPWMTTNYTSAAGISDLVDSMNTLLLAGQLSARAKTNIVNYVTNTVNFPFSSPPTAIQVRDRVRAVVHQILVSPDYTIQK